MISNENSAWSLQGTAGELRGGFGGRVDVARPEIGLHDMVLSAGKPAGTLLSVCLHAEDSAHESLAGESKPDWPLAVGDVYVRGNDLVARYEPADDWPYSPQIYWRADALESFAGLAGSLSLVVSMQTHLLDTWPRISLGSHLPCREALHVSFKEGKQTHAESLGRDTTIRSSSESCCILRRLADVPLSYAEIMPASDFQDVRVRDVGAGNCRVVWTLFSEFLEKGVIRRARLHGALVSRENDLELAAACCDTIERCALPLTT